MNTADESPEVPAWMQELQRTKEGLGPPTQTAKNIRIILQNAVDATVFRFNEFANRIIYGVKPPWNAKKIGDEIADIDAVNVMCWLANQFRFEPSQTKILEAIQQIASENVFHPVREYILGLEWDGVPRIENWLKNYAGAEAREVYLRAISRKFLCAMVARVFQPGIKFDHVLVLEGAQGIGKSRLADALGTPWFTDAKLDFRDKDAVQTIFGCWVVELGELAGLRHADLETTKAFVSRRVDRIRVSFGRISQNYPRQCVFIGTTNADEYLKDPTGERRYWPVKTTAGKFDLEGLAAVRDQLMAEAYIIWRDFGENLWLNDVENQAAKFEQEERTEGDVWEEIIWGYLDAVPECAEGLNWEKFPLKQLFMAEGPLPIKNPTYGEQRRAADALKRLGFEKHVHRIEGINTKVWVKSIKGNGAEEKPE